MNDPAAQAEAIIATARLRLAPLAADDTAAFHALMVEPGVRRYLLEDEIVSYAWASTVVADNAATFAAYGWGIWGIRLKERPRLIGIAGFREFFDPSELQLIYALHPDHWGRGIASEAVSAVIRFGIDRLGMTEILACTDLPNSASLAVMRRLGLRFIRQVDDRGAPRVYYGIAADEWRARQEAPG
ncbi:MAG: GNAT family N-acetyltransferase [Alphaproteobacteria bacterium]